MVSVFLGYYYYLFILFLMFSCTDYDFCLLIMNRGKLIIS